MDSGFEFVDRLGVHRFSWEMGENFARGLYAADFDPGWAGEFDLQSQPLDAVPRVAYGAVGELDLGGQRFGMAEEDRLARLAGTAQLELQVRFFEEALFGDREGVEKDRRGKTLSPDLALELADGGERERFERKRPVGGQLRHAQRFGADRVRRLFERLLEAG